MATHSDWLFCWTLNISKHGKVAGYDKSIFRTLFPPNMIIIPSNEMKVFDWLIEDPTFGMLLLANLSKHNIRFYSSVLKRKRTKGNNTLTPRMPNIIRCCTSRCKSRCRCCTFERESRCNETFVMHKCLNAGANHV